MGNSSTEHRERVKDILKGDIYSQVKDVVGYGTRDAGRSERCDGGQTRGKGLFSRDFQIGQDYIPRLQQRKLSKEVSN